MYEKYWGLTKKPFENTVTPEFLYFSSQHEEALCRLAYAIREKKGAALLTGGFGCGKSLLAQSLMDELSKEKFKIVTINNPQLDYLDFLRSIVRSLKAIELPQKKTELSADYLLEVLGQILENNMRNGNETVIIIDEAQLIEDKHVFEELRLLLNFQYQGRFLVTLILLGQPELKQKIDDNKQLDQRIAIKYYLDSLNQEDTTGYILHRLSVAGREEPIFTKEAIDAIYENTGGIPRRINQLCDTCLLAGFAKKLNHIDKPIVLEEVRGLSQEVKNQA